MNQKVIDIIEGVYQSRTKHFWMLLDPERESLSELTEAAEIAVENGVDGILVGSSSYEQDGFSAAVHAVKKGIGNYKPVLIFPGGHKQVSTHADAILFLSLLSGRNSQYLIGEQLLAVPHVHRIKLETIPTGYLLIESGSETSVQQITQTAPLPRDRADLIATYALTGQYMGKRVIYLEAGSGAMLPVPAHAIEQTRMTIEVPLIVGGGIRTSDQANAAAIAGADFVVIGTALEHARDHVRVAELADAVHSATDDEDRIVTPVEVQNKNMR